MWLASTFDPGADEVKIDAGILYRAPIIVVRGDLYTQLILIKGQVT